MKKIISVVAAIIKNSENKYLCTLRPNGKHLANLWEFPGGKIEKDETPHEALKREIREELSITLQLNSTIFSNTFYEYEHNIINLICIQGEIISGEIQLLEHADYIWLPKEKLSELSWAPADIEVVNKISNL